MTEDVLNEALPEAAEETVEILEVPERPFLTTNFDDYTVTEGLLLSLLLCVFVAVCCRIWKEGFSWL